MALAAVTAAACGFLFATSVFGTMILDPAAIDWLMHDDRGQNFLGWHLYRNEPESFPLGEIPSLLAPVGASLAYTDAIPWLSIAAKPISPFLPATFQFAGLWLATCYALQGLFGFLLLQRLLGEWPTSLTGSLLIVLSPVLLHRKGHVSLCGQWLLLAALLAYANSRRVGLRRFVASWAPIVILACGTHPYLAAMVLAVASSACIDGADIPRSLRLGFRRPRFPWSRLKEGGLRLLILAAIAAISLHAFGYVGAPDRKEWGFGFYSADLLTLINPVQWSAMIPAWPTSEGEFEGFGFLGTGPALLIALVAIGWRTHTNESCRTMSRRVASLPTPVSLGIAIAGMTIYAFGSQLRVASLPLGDLSGPYSLLDPLPSVFRASGRFIWPLHYCVLVAAIVAARILLRGQRLTSIVLVSAALLQVVDSWHVYAAQNVGWMAASNKHWNSLRSPLWDGVGRDYTEIRLVPPYVHDAECLPSQYRPYSYIPFAYLAGLQHMRLNSGHLSRQPRSLITAFCQRFSRELAAGHMDPKSIYVVSEPERDRFLSAFPKVAVCGSVDGMMVCVRKDHATDLRDALASTSPTRSLQEGPGGAASGQLGTAHSSGDENPSR